MWHNGSDHTVQVLGPGVGLYFDGSISSVEGCLFSSRPEVYGVPQGSIVRPLSFHTEFFPWDMTTIRTTTFADDTHISQMFRVWRPLSWDFLYLRFFCSAPSKSTLVNNMKSSARKLRRSVCFNVQMKMVVQSYFLHLWIFSKTILTCDLCWYLLNNPVWWAAQFQVRCLMRFTWRKQKSQNKK